MPFARTGASTTALTTSGGDEHSIVLQAASPIRKLAPFIPMVAGAIATEYVCGYAPIASIFWALFLLRVVHWAGSEPIYANLLDPDSVEAAIDAAVRHGFVLVPYQSWGHLVTDLDSIAGA